LTSYNWNPFSGQQDDLPFRIYEMIFQPGVNAIRVAWGVSFVLVLVILILFLTARMVGASKPGSRLIPLPIRRRSTSAEVPS
jgi:phosphate transport system permease protein